MHARTSKALYAQSQRVIYLLLILVMLVSVVGVNPVAAEGTASGPLASPVASDNLNIQNGPALAPDCVAPPNEIVAENCKTGNPPNEWDVIGAGDDTIEGFATDISVNHGNTIHFKIKTDATAYHLDIYRLGYYEGNGARKIAGPISPSASLPQDQPTCLFDGTPVTDPINLVDCGNWAESASWSVPLDAVSGIYIAKLVRDGSPSGASHITFIVRDDDGNSDLLFQTSDTTWQAYNGYGGYSLYAAPNHAHKVSYNRPFLTRTNSTEDFLFNAEYPMLRWLERNGYNVSYFTDMDTDRYGSELLEHKAFLSIGHDEYWSAGQRAAVEAARAAGVNLAFFSGNEIYWKTRWEPSTDGSNTPFRTLVSYKEGALAAGEHYTCAGNYDCDPLTPPIWTGLWRDGCELSGHDGCKPENALSGQISWMGTTRAIQVSAEDGKMRFWRNTSVASLSPGTTTTLEANTLGYEWDFEQYQESYPTGRIWLSTTFADGKEHHLSLYRANSGALVFGAGTVQWMWGLDGNHDRGASAEDPRMQQATVNLFADMGVQPASLQTELIAATASTDVTSPTSTITSPTNGSAVNGNVTISGTADGTGGEVGGVDVSVDGGLTWQHAAGHENWSFSWTPSTIGSVNIKTRAVDDSGNIETPSAGITVNVEPRACPCSIWNDTTLPDQANVTDGNPIEVGVRFRVDIDGYVTGVRFYKGNLNTGTHIGHLWTNTGTQLAEATFTGESTSGWQEVVFDSPVSVQTGTTYVASYHSSGYFADNNGPYFTAGNAAAYTNPPVRAMIDGVDGSNAVFKYGNSAFPDQTWNQSNYWVDIVFNTSVGPDINPPTIQSVSPANGATGIVPSTTLTATFNEAVDGATISDSTFELRDASSNLIPATVSYSTASRKATLIPNAALATSTIYTATVKSGTSGVADVAGNKLVTDYVWSFTTSSPPPLPPDEGPGGPILVIADATNVSNPFGRYYAEILRAEGFNAYFVTDISNVSAITLADYDVVLLGEMPLSSDQITMFDNWVVSGGNLIAFRPSKSLAALYGLTDASGTTSEGYLAVNTSTSIGQGVVGDTMQFHGAADQYTLSGATSLATLYSNSTTPTANPAIVRYTRGSGQVVIFAFDLARSIILMRQGNPAWAGQEGDGTNGIRASDMFVGRSGQPNWIDNNKLLIPQADEQMHVLSHAIEQLNAAKLPLPRLWYFPNRIKGALIMTGDSEGCSGSCINVPMQHAQSYGGNYTAYILGTQPTPTEVNGWLAAGSGVAPHYDDTAEASNPTYATMNAVYDSMTQNHFSAYGLMPRTVRNHWIVWTGWADQAKIEAAHGIGLDTNYYHWGAWLSGPGYFTGSGLPLRFADENGQILDIFQATTQLPDETWYQNIDTTFKTLIDRSIDQGYYGFLTANFHPPSYGSFQTVAGNMMAYANIRGVPIWSAEKLLDFLQARNQARTENMVWNGTQLTFDFNALSPYNGLTLMIPAQAGGNDLLSITSNGSPVSFDLETIKGYDYALFTASNGSYTASYQPDTIAPTIISHAPTANATGVAINANVTVTFDEAIDEATINGTTFTLKADGASSDVAAAVTYDSQLMTAKLDPNSDLDYDTLYHVTVSNTIRDLSNNALANNHTWSFTTGPMPPPSVTDTTVSDFSAGTLNSCVADPTIGDGAIRLGAAIDETFSGSGLPSGWSSYPWSGGVPNVTGGLLSVDGVSARNNTLYGPGHTLEFVATFNADAYQHIGFGANEPTFSDGPWIMFSTGNNGTQLYARITTSSAGPYNTGDDAIGLGSQYLGGPHQYRIVWNTSSIDLYIDGVQVVTRNATISDSMRVAVSDYVNNGTTLTADWLRMSPPFASPCIYTSRVFDAGATVNWDTISWNGSTPSGTSLALSYRTGNTSAPNGSWTGFTTVASSGAALNGSSRYIQYQADLSTSDTSQTPVLQDVTITYSIAGPDLIPPTIIGRTPIPNATDALPDTNVTVTFDEAMNAGSITDSTFSLRADGAGSDVAATVTYDALSMTATLNPNSDLTYSTLYHVTVSGSVSDTANNLLGSDHTWSFTTAAAPPLILTDTTVSDFNAGTLNSCIADATIGDGAMRLPAAIDEGFSGSGLPTGWDFYDWPYDAKTGVFTVLGGLVSVDGMRVNQADPVAYGPGRSLEFVATFAATANQHLGFASGNNVPPNEIFNNTPAVWAIFSTGSFGEGLQARTWSSAGNIDYSIPGSWLGSPHLYRIEWTDTNVVYFIDGTQVASQSYSSAGTTMRPAISDLTQDGTSLSVDWMRVLPYTSPCTFTSRVFDAGEAVNWDTISWTGSIPTNTSLNLSYRIGNTTTLDGLVWSNMTGTSPKALAGNSRYIQYQAVLSSASVTQTPNLQDVTFVYHPGADTIAPTISSVVATPSGDGNAFITWNTDEPSDSLVLYGTTPGALNLSENSISLDTSHTIPLTGLATDTTYYYRVTSMDAASNSSTSPLISDQPAAFTTPPVIYTLTDTTTADFNAGSGSCPVDATIGNGAVRLPLMFDESFSGTELPTGWTSTPWGPGGTTSVGSGQMTVNGAIAVTNASYDPGRSLEFVATFGAATFQHVGFVTDSSFNSPWIIFSTASSTTNLYARSSNGSDALIPGSWLGTPHRYRIDWTPTNITYYIDGQLVNTRSSDISSALRLVASDLTVDGPAVSVDWLKMSPFTTPCTFNSRVIDAGDHANWLDLNWVGATPTGSSVNFETRTGQIALPDGSWSTWQAVNSPIASPNGRYIQYRATLATTDPAQTPVIESVALTNKAVITPAITWNDPAEIPYGTVLSGIQLNATASVPGTFTYTPDVGTILNVGPRTLHVEFTPTDITKYTTASKDVTINVNKATASITLGGLTHEYDGTQKMATVTTVPAGLIVIVTYAGVPTLPTSAGDYAVVATINDSNYTGIASDTLVIAKATATIALADLNPTYDGNQKSVTVTTNPTDLTVDVTYGGLSIEPTNAASYAVTATVNDANYAGTASDTLVIAKASSTTTVSGGGTFVYDGNPHSATVTVARVGGLNLNPSPLYSGNCSAAPVNVVDTPCTASYTYPGDNNHTGSSDSKSIAITRAIAAITLGGLSPTYDGTPKSAIAATVPADLGVEITYDGLLTLPTELGSYTVVATVTDPNYSGTASGMLVITKATATHSLALEQGWNLVSFNVQPTSTTIATVLSNIAGKYDLVYAWDATGAHSASGNWMKYAPSAPEYSNSLSSLEETMGFWIHMTAPGTLNVAGSVPVTTNINLSTAVGGWNLVAYPSGPNHLLPDALSNHGVGTDFLLMYAYHANETADPWKLFSQTAPVWANDLTELAPGWGYWVKVSADHTWSVKYLAD